MSMKEGGQKQERAEKEAAGKKFEAGEVEEVNVQDDKHTYKNKRLQTK